ncbi:MULTISPECIES: ABC transporter ATP-binding protein [Bordetella]|uniref:ABC transporter ATP-binding protein n=2 Tax=Bordetella TaxID=517 RepID=A0A261V7I8_9BORD|nr:MULTISPECIES: ABC transporter ATP-binding protein [Bordetella]MDM9559063.1 ABC transporter ATP-binding protein [Bordetella petrii]OZI69777.1 ABC transporter ATP-binding protein [Bordetella genomosp. 2]
MDAPILEVRDLVTAFHTPMGEVRAVDGVSLQVRPGTTLGIVGESGSGKSMLSLSIMGLVPPPGRIQAGQILFEGRDLRTLSAARMREIRGNRIAMVFQEPMTSLNPVHTVGFQIMEAVRAHHSMADSDLKALAIEALAKVRISSPERRFAEYPHQLSGGMRQRVMIAMALACKPAVLIADEPTTALDVTIQAQILQLLRDLQQETGMAIVLITHDLGVIAQCADEVAVMYAGKVMEAASVSAVFQDTQHPYTLGLMSSLPRMSADTARLLTIRGTVPPPFRYPAGCRFNPRCLFASERCRRDLPALEEVAPGHAAACWNVPLEQFA